MLHPLKTRLFARGLAFCLFTFLASWTRTAEAATIGEAHVMVFKQGGSTTRSVGSLIGVWHWTGRTFLNQHANVWMRARELASDASSDVFGVKILRTDPRYAFVSSERGAARWTGTTWIETFLQTNTGSVLHSIGLATSSFAVVGNPNQHLWRWSGTSWLHDIDGASGSGSFKTVTVLSTDYAFAFLDPATSTIERAVLHWRGTTWRSHLNHGGAAGVGGMTATNYGWYLVDPDSGTAGAYQWTGTSWRLHSTLGPWDTRAADLTTFLTIPGENDFAVAAGVNGELWRWAGTSWLDETGNTAQTIQSGAVYSTDHAWLVGSAGTVLRWTGTSWVVQGINTTQVLAGASIARTDYAWITGLGGSVFLWRGTSWVAEPDTEIGTLRMLASDTVGESLSMLAADKLMLLTKQRVNLIDDAVDDGVSDPDNWTGTLYRTVVQVTPTDSTWNWDSDATLESYFGVVNRDGNTYQFWDEADGSTAGRQIVLENAIGATTTEDIFIWEDTVGLWDGHSENPHNQNADSGIKLTQGGAVFDETSSDVWGEADYNIDGGSGTTWETAVGNTGVSAGNDLVWEFWHFADAGFSQGDTIDTGLHVNDDPLILGGDDIEGIRWEYRVGHYTPRTANWRWCRDDAADPEIMKEPGGQLTEVSVTGEKLRLRLRVDETNGGWMASATGDSGWTLWYSTDQVNWTQVTTSSSVWMLYNGQGGAGNTVGEATLPGIDTLGIKVERNAAQNGFKQEPFTEAEMDYSIQSSAAATGTVYYFQARNNGYQALVKPGVRYPSVRTTDDTTQNYVYTSPDLGRFSRPMVNPALAAGGNGDAFKVVYVGTQGGSGDQLFAISRTNGGLVRSYSASGTLEHGNLYWDSTNSAYNLYFRQGNSSILALKDNGGTITTNASWASNPLDMTNLISRPVRVFDGDRQNYLMLLVTSYQGNSSTLYKVRGADGTVMTDGEYSKKLPGGWAGGLRVTGNLYPLWIEGTSFALATNSSPGIVKIPNGPATPTVLHESDGGDATPGSVPAFGPTYTRTTITTGGRVMFSCQNATINGSGNVGMEAVLRINDADMTGVEWINGVVYGLGVDIDDGDTLKTSAFSPPFQSAFPVPVFIGDSAQINRLAGSDGTQEANFPYTLTGGISTEIAIKGNWLYFGTDGGYIYALSATDPSQEAGTRFRVPGDFNVVGVALDSTNSLVYYTTEDGRIYQFDTR